ncbi:MAG: DUF2461 domain-containing protein [Oscillospiraceae bacterium]|nr:DUF2461 domain-containing protein [Oscillospiraceae bacterium]
MFQGFNEETIAFLWGVRFNNEKGWFEQNKPSYINNVYEPIKTLGYEVFDEIRARFPEQEMLCKVSRIYRDARRLHGRGPYKDHMWFCLRRGGGDWTERPAFWFELAPEGYSYGMGFYSAKAATMERFRKELDANPRRFCAIAEGVAKLRHMTVGGEEYARRKGEPGGVLNDWYNRKHISVERSVPYDEQSFSPALKEELVESFSALMPLYQWFDEFCTRTDS